MPGIIDLQNFKYEDLEKIVAGGHGSFGIIGNPSRYIHTHYTSAIAFIVYSIYVFSSHDDNSSLLQCVRILCSNILLICRNSF